MKKPPKLKGYEYSSQTVNDYIKAGKILILYLAYNSECDLSCPFCFTYGGKRAVQNLNKDIEKEKPLEFDDFTNIINQGVELGVRSVCFYGEGEPLLRKDLDLFFKLVDYANSRNLTSVVFTNGVSITPEVARKLHQKKISVVGKLYSFNPETNEFLTGEHWIYKYVSFMGKQVPSHIPNLTRAGYKDDDRLALFTVVTKCNYKEIEDIWKWERAIGVIPYVDFLYTYRHQRKFGISDNERERLCKSLYEYDKSLNFDHEFHVGPHVGHRVCNTEVAAVIGANGQLRICPAININVGDIRKEPLAKLLERRAIIADRTGFESEDKGKCGAYRLEESGCKI
jgi:MoaA/NifB/PqqE/SkfB family radical SAM enzyme